MTLLQVAINPFVAVLGDEKSSSSRLTLAQAFNSLGTAIAPAVGAFFILSDTIKTKAQIAGLTHSMKESYFAAEAAAVQLPFVTIAAVIALVAIVFLFAKLPKLIESNERTSYWDLLHHKNLLYGVLGIFFYVGAEVAIGSYLVNYLLDMDLVPIIKNNTFMKSIAEGILNAELIQKDQKAIVGVFVTFYWSGAMIGRFLGAYLTKKYSPGKVIGIFAFCAIVLALVSISTTGLTAMWSLITIGLFNSIMFPTIFSLAIGGLGVLKPKASGLLCMAIVGGALVPPMFGFLADTGGFKIALLLVVFCYAYIAFFGFRNYRMKNSIL
jgi:FHS family L-fucose permease-like MFS transporter